MSASDDSSPAAGRFFQFRCLRCRSVLEARSGQSGQQARCPTCDALFTVPVVDARTGRALSDADPGDDGELPTPVHAYAAAGDRAPIIIRKDDDSQAIRCSRCDGENPIDADRCIRCGLPFTLEGAEAIGLPTPDRLGRQILLLIVVAVGALLLVVMFLSTAWE